MNILNNNHESNSNLSNIIQIILLLLVFLLAVSSPSIQAAPINAPQIPVDIGQSYYPLGGGRIIPPPGAGATTFNINARFKVGLGYSCGKFDFQDNIKTMVNDLKTKVRQIPGQLTTAVSGAIAGLPAYLLQKANPTLYNLITKTLDETTELFRLSYKSCQQVEQEMQKNPDANPYQGFMKASIADRWTFGADSGSSIADTKQDIDDGVREPIKWIGGNLYGSASNPIQINRDVVVAGYNIMIGRTGDVSVITSPTGSALNDPIVKIWPNPASAGAWVQGVLGDLKVIVTNIDNIPTTVAGKGLRPKVEDLKQSIAAALDIAVKTDDYQPLNQYRSILVSAAIVESLRSMPIGERLIMSDRLASELAVNEARERLMLIKQMMLTGLNAPDLVSSTGGSVATKYIRGTTFHDMDRVTEEIMNTLQLKQKTLNTTTIAIINHANTLQTTATRGLSTPIQAGPTSMRGAVAQ